MSERRPGLMLAALSAAILLTVVLMLGIWALSTWQASVYLPDDLTSEQIRWAQTGRK